MKKTLGIILGIGLFVGTYQYAKLTHLVHRQRAALHSTNEANRKANPTSATGIQRNYGNLPLAFEKNEGQSDARVKFFSRGSGYTFFLTSDEAVLSLVGSAASADSPDTSGNRSRRQAVESSLRVKFVGANLSAPVNGVDELPSKSNYFTGSDTSQWRTNIPNYAKVKYASLFPGVDLVYYGTKHQIEYDFLLAPDANPRVIRFDVGVLHKPIGSTDQAVLRISSSDDLIVKMAEGYVRFHKPVAYQENASGIKHFVDAHYVIGPGQGVGFALGPYDKSKRLVIDPVLSYSTYLGPSGGVNSLAVDSSGNIYVTGGNTLAGFPVTSGAFQTTCPADCFPAGSAFVSKFNATGSSLIYSTYLAPSDGGGAFGVNIAVDSAGDAYVVGSTESPSFPTTTGAFQTVCRDCVDGGIPYSGGAFVTKLNSTGSALVYSTYVSGSVDDSGHGIAVDASGNAYITGGTSSSDFPVTPGSFQQTYDSGGDAFVSELNPTGSALIYSTFLGGDNSGGVGISVNSAGNAYVVGGTQSQSFPTTSGAFDTACTKCSSGTDSSGHPLQDAFITELNTIGSALVYSTYLGGSDADFPEAIALDLSGDAYVTGVTYSDDFPTTTGAFQTACGGENCGGELADAFISKLNPTGSALVYSTYLGGSSYDFAASIAVDSSGDAYITGGTTSVDFPITSGAFQTQCDNCTLTNYVSDAFLSELNPAGSALLYSTYFGGSDEDNGEGIALDANSNVYIGGGTNSTDFPTTPGSYQPTATSSTTGAFVAKFSPGAAQATFSFSAASGGNCPMGGNCSMSATVTAGQTATYDLEISPAGGFNGTVSLDCTDALAESTCSVSPSSVAVSGTNATAFAVTVTTTASSSLGPLSKLITWRTQPMLNFCILLMLALVLIVCAISARNSTRRLFPALAFLSLSLVYAAGCSSAASSNNSGGNSGTRSGIVTITGTSSGVNQSVSLNLTVN